MHVQKILILTSLKETCSQFKGECPEVTSGFSAFSELRLVAGLIYSYSKRKFEPWVPLYY
jgi:hypothetical protein